MTGRCSPPRRALAHEVDGDRKYPHHHPRRVCTVIHCLPPRIPIRLTSKKSPAISPRLRLRRRRATKSCAAECHSGKRNRKPAVTSLPGTTRRLLRTNSDSARVRNVPISITHYGVGSPKRMHQVSRNTRMKSQFGSGLGEARFTTPLNSSRAISHSIARTKSAS